MKKFSKNIEDKQLIFDLDVPTLIYCYDCKIYYNKLSKIDLSFHKKLHKNRNEIERKEIERKEIERNEIERKEIERKEIERNEIERKEIERKEIERKEIERKEIEIKEIERKEIERKEIDKDKDEIYKKLHTYKKGIERKEIDKTEMDKSNDYKIKKLKLKKLEAVENFYKLNNIFFYHENGFDKNNFLKINNLSIKTSDLAWVELRKFKRVYIIYGQSKDIGIKRKMNKIKLIRYLKGKIKIYKNQQENK